VSADLLPPSTPVDVPPPSRSGTDADATRAARRARRRRRWKIAGAITFVIVSVAGGITAWALDRYVIDHVVISDVSSYEDAAREAQAAAVATDTGDTNGTSDTSGTSDTADVDDTVSADATSASTDPVIELTTVVTGSGDDTVTYYVADVTVADATQIRAGFADDAYGTNIVQNTSDIAAFYDAVFAVNGDYYGFRDSGIMIRNGVIYRDDGARTGLVLYADGTMAVYDETATTAEELLADGAWQTWSFGPALVDGGQILDGIEDVEIDTNIGNHSIQGEQPRTAVGMISPNHFVFVVVDGRSTGYSKGVTMTELAQIMVDLGCTVAYNLDGGGSSTMYAEGDLVNDPLGKGQERGTSDIIYIAEGVVS